MNMKKIIYLLMFTLFFIGCDDRLEELNTDKRNPAEVDPQTLFSQGLRQAVDMMTSISVNDNPFNLYAQYWAQTTYPDESQYDMVGRSIPFFFWRNGYRDVLSDLNEAKRLIQLEIEEGNSIESDAVLTNRIAAIDILSSYIYVALVDAFGNVPYSEALDPDNINPAYDDARSVYDNVIADIDAAVATVNPNEPGFSDVQDLLYSGEMNNWVKFANSLKLRMGMRLADVDKTASVSIVNAALTAGVFTSNSDNASMDYQSASPNTSPIYEDLVLSGRQDFVAANTIVNIMNELEDPRRPVYFRQNLGEGTFQGGIYGDANNYSGFSQVGEVFHALPDLPGTLLTYAEVEFLQAEAAERGGYAVTGTAQEHYNAGILASFNRWASFAQEAGLDVPLSENPEELYQQYIAQPEVNYETAPGDWKQKIGIQMWLALYAQGFEGWNTWKRLDFEALNPPPGMTMEDIPVRFIYPLEEAQYNGPSYKAAGEAIGGDDASTPVFWDVN